MPATRRADGLTNWGVPTPLPDELGTSVIARSLRNWGYLDRARVLKQLVGSSHRVLHAGCPPGITTLAGSFENAGPHAALRFIHRHTLVPYLLSATPPIEARRIATRLAQIDDRALYSQLRLQALAPVLVENLQFCRVCAAGDALEFGEPYWRRAHQIRGIAHCPTHGCRLSRTEVPLIVSKAADLVAASTVLRSRKVFPRAEALFNLTLERLFAKRVVGVLSRRRLGTVEHKLWLRKSLLRLGYTTAGPNVSASVVAADFVRFLRAHCCSLDSLGGPRDWHLRLFTPSSAPPTPLQLHVFSAFYAHQVQAAEVCDPKWLTFIFGGQALQR